MSDSMHSGVPQASTMENWLGPSQPLVLTLGLNQVLQGDGFRTVAAENAQHVLRRLREEDVAVLLLGSELTSAQALDILAQCTAEQSTNSRVAIVFCGGPEPELFQKFVDEGLVFYLTRGEIRPEQICSLVAAYLNRASRKSSPDPDPLFTSAPSAERLLDFCVRLPMQIDLSSARGLVVNVVSELIDASYVQCLIYDADEQTLTNADAENKEVSYSAASGLTAFVASTGARLNIDRVGADARYDSDIDNPGGSESARLIAEPIVGADGVPVAVITAVRGAESAAFSAEDLRILRSIAEFAAPTFSQIILQKRVQGLLTGRATDPNSEVFRREALEYHIRSWDQQGDVLKTLPMWLRRSYWIVLVMVLIGLAGVAVLVPGLKNLFGKVN
ncbi:MAG: GAF domain-containing protein [Candidatus Sulfotelmatobacter sp.]